MKFHQSVLRSVFAGLLCGAGMLEAEVKMPAIFGTHMVLQQGTKLPVWGTADAGEKVTVTVGGETGTATADADGKWRVELAPLPANSTPVSMTVAGKNTLTFEDVLVGDVWICSGQSNMEFGINNEYNAKDEVPKANIPLLRLFLVPHKTSVTPESDVAPAPSGTLGGQWVVCTPEDIIKVGGWSGFSAVGYFFGREIQAKTGQPVGLIGTYWGGTPAQAWTSIEKLSSEPALKHYVDAYNVTKANYPAAMEKLPGLQEAYQANLAKWKKVAGLADNATPGEVRAASVKAKAEGKPQAPMPPPQPDGGPNSPTNLYNGMIAPLIPYAIKGAIWYQGESNAGAAFEYRTLFGDMITDWRQRWGEGDFPFLFVQLANFKNPNAGFALLRESQLKTLELPNTGMAVAADIGDQNDIHPKDKEDVGHRLALAARHVAYGETLVYSGPIYDKMQVENGAIRVSFTQTGGGLIIGTAPWTSPGTQPLSNTTLAGFMIAGADQKWVPADAKIDGNDVVVSSGEVVNPPQCAMRSSMP